MRRTPFFLVAVGVWLLDQSTKMLAVQTLPLNISVPVTDFFSLTHVHNTGAAFGVMPGNNWAFVALTAAVLAVLAFLHGRLTEGGATAEYALAFLWGGAVGNLTDRLLRGSVVDFLDFHLRENHWPAFNAADSAICVGVALLLLEGFFEKHLETVHVPDGRHPPR
jgi:signal peptidase II